MTLLSGARLGPYEIVASIGAGGMGEVFRARDTKLNREVAIKVLPAAFADDPERLARFTREAQTLASLNHPNIAAIYGLENVGAPLVGALAEDRERAGTRPAPTGPTIALVMELVEGEDLSTHIARGPIPIAEALPIARQIAEALEAAHEQGIVHRDLKPANIKVRSDGTVKVLDFGLAKAMDGSSASNPNVSHSPTLTHQGTQAGMIIGTAAYMSPEQAKGKAVDRRADIWAFGVVLYEMLTGKRAFKGDDVSETLASVLKDTLSMDALPKGSPEAVRRLLRRCLEKDPKRRLSSIADARLELDDATAPGDGAAPVAAPSGIPGRERWLWATVAGLALMAALTFALRSAPARVEAPTFRFGILPPGEGRWDGTPRMAISPDGQSLVFVAPSRTGSANPLWLRRLDSMDSTPVAGTESPLGTPSFPFWSPDSRQVAFFMQSPRAAEMTELRIANLQGGTARTVLDLPGLDAGGSWNADGVLLVASRGTRGVQRVSTSGGPLTPVTTLDASRGEVLHLYPQFLPDGRRFIYQSQTAARDDWAIFLGSIDSPVRRKLVRSEYARFAAPDLLLYTQAQNLLAQTMDPRTEELTGQPVVIATGVPSLALNGRAGFSVSDTGVLVYKSNPEAQGPVDRQLTWIDRRGQVLEVVGPRVASSSVRLSPDGARVALPEPPGSLWVADLALKVKAPVMLTEAASPTWSADGTRLVFGHRTGTDAAALAEREADGARSMRTLHQDKGVSLLVPFDETSDGRLVVFGRVTGSASRGISVLSKADGKVTPYLEGGFTGSQASLSPDGRWLAYTSNESGSSEVIVQPFPDPEGGKWQVSPNGGSAPRWRRDGRELFYLDGEGRLVSVPVTAGPTFAPGRATPLFSLANGLGRGQGWSAGIARGQGGTYGYDAAPDGQKFLLSLAPNDADAGPVVPLTVITNWTSLLKKQKR